MPLARYQTKGRRAEIDKGFSHDSFAEDLISTDELSRRLGVHPLTPVIWRRQNRGPKWLAAPDVKLVRYRWGDALSWLESNSKNAKRGERS